jgi:ubiquitin carboxyl-terminal hydrolase 8
MDLSIYDNKGYIGLANLGNTCFMNSCLQILNHTYELNHILSLSKSNSNIDTIIKKEWNELQNQLWGSANVVIPKRFLQNIHKVAIRKKQPLFTGYAQNDMSEFLLFFIECLHNSCSQKIEMKINGKPENKLDKKAIACYNMLQAVYKKEYSKIHELFYGIYNSEIIAIDNKKVYSTNYELFFILDLPMSKSSLIDCFDEFTKQEFIEGDNAWFHEKTKTYIDVYKKMSFWSLPNVLVITIKRFSPCGRCKRNDLITYPLCDLDLSAYITGYNPQKYIYDLFGVCNHYGSTDGGHYTAFVLNSKKEWLHFNDTNCEIVSENNVVVQSAYCLFYRIKTL